MDGDVSPDNQRYYYLIRSIVAPFTGGIIVVKVTDGTIVKYMNYGDANLTPFALTVNKLDRLAFISRVTAGSSSVYFYDNTVTSDMLIISQWDSYLGETSCNKFAWSKTNTFTAVNWLTTATVGNLPNYKTAPMNAYGVFDVNNFGMDSST